MKSSRWKERWRYAQDTADDLRVYPDHMKLLWSRLYQECGKRIPYLATDSFGKKQLSRRVLFSSPGIVA